MIPDRVQLANRTTPKIERASLMRAKYDRKGIFLEGRVAEMDALRSMGARDASLGRLYEGHFNGALLVALYGNDGQRRAAYTDVDAGHLFGVWNTQDDDPVRVDRNGTHFRLSGSKTWASGADSVTRGLITARDPDGNTIMCLVPLDRLCPAVDSAAWKPLGMRESNSYRVVFDGVILTDDDIIGRPNDYERPPWFLGGALRFVAVHAGIIERLTAETLAYLVSKHRDADPFQCARAAEMRIAARGAWNWVRAACDAWCDDDRLASEESEAAALDLTDMARAAVERAALDVCERAMRSVGAHGLVEPLPFAQLIRDTQMYLRQPAPDAVLARIGTSGFRNVRAARNVAIAFSTGSSS